MYIFHLVKGQENFNSRSKMAHLPLIEQIIKGPLNVTQHLVRDEKLLKCLDNRIIS